MSIYCDHNATTPLRAEVLETMLPYLRDDYGNASSVHALGSRARCAVEDARGQVAALIGAHADEIVFTSGGTEANNLAIGGSVWCSGGRVLTTAIEHASVRLPVNALQANGCVLAEVPIDAVGRIALDEMATLLDEPTSLVTIGWANNEIGTVQAIEPIGAHCRRRGISLHVDAVQAVGKIPVQVRNVDLLSISAHKLGGPKGVGALFVRHGVEVRPLLLGGEQERGRRAGTENVAGIVGMGEACRLVGQELGAFGEACVAMRDALWDGLRRRIPRVTRNSPDGADCLPNTLNVSFEGVRGEALVAALDLEGVAVSSGSACAAGAGEPSHVLLGLGRGADAARDGVRFSFGRTNTLADLTRMLTVTSVAVERMRAANGWRRSVV